MLRRALATIVAVEKQKYYIIWVCVCKCLVLVIHHVKRMRLIILLSVASAWLNHIFPHYLLKSAIFGKHWTWNVFWFSLLSVNVGVVGGEQYFAEMWTGLNGLRIWFSVTRRQWWRLWSIWFYVILAPFFWTLLLINSTVVDCFMFLCFPIIIINLRSKKLLSSISRIN